MPREFIEEKAGYVHRERLDRLFDKGMAFAFISVVAGPGYGKTVAVAAYAKRTPMNVIWLRLQESDCDSQRFWSHFTDAVGRELPALAENLRKITLSAVLGIYDMIGRMFEEALCGGRQVLMVFDSFERASSHHVTGLLRFLLKAEIGGLHIIVVSNEKAAVSAIVPGSGQLRVTMDDLCFTMEEMAALFALYDLHPGPAEMARVAEATGRWPLALHLFCVNRGAEGPGSGDKTNQQLAAELFEKHYFSGYSKQMQHLLVGLSCFESFPMALVTRLTGEEAGQVVDELAANVFINYDYTAGLFHFQTMYRAFLSRRQALLTTEQLEELYEFMGGWCLQNGCADEALEYFWRVKNYDSYLKTVSGLPRVRRSADNTAEILRCLDQFPAERKNLEFDFCRAVLLLNGMEVERATKVLKKLVRVLAGKPGRTETETRLLGDSYVVLADISLLMNRDDGLEPMKKAAELLREGCRVRTRELMLVGNNGAFYLPGNSAGQRQRMEDYFFEYARYSDRVANGSGYGHEWLFAAESAFLAGEFDRSRENCFQAIAKAALAEQHDIICNAYWNLMRTELYQGDCHRAEQWLSRLSAHVEERHIAELFELRDCASSWFHIRVGDYGAVAPWVAEVAPLRTDRLLDVGRNRIIIIYYLSALGRLNEAYAEITRLEEVLRRSGRWQERVFLLVHKALRLLERGDRERAVDVFKSAYDMVYQNGIVVIFAEFGKHMQRLIRTARTQERVPFDASWLELVYKKAGSFEKRAAAVKKAYFYKEKPAAEDFNLNPREREILTYMAQGMTRSEIALHMNMSLSNVKRYVGNIYTKLRAIGRADAIYIATLNGLVDATDDK
ncbi:LuxR C-terminal-related transcriptional regulator [Oscillospiraceae bacterium OttesenSCG-928-F05]|nr:LuxR C-terminal-related transcriptional regulator [Oscillospiraceae bacterium OttesenSCG-928-F05]